MGNFTKIIENFGIGNEPRFFEFEAKNIRNIKISTFAKNGCFIYLTLRDEDYKTRLMLFGKSNALISKILTTSYKTSSSYTYPRENLDGKYTIEALIYNNNNEKDRQIAEIRVEFDTREEYTSLNFQPFSEIINQKSKGGEKKWYKGDFHTHSTNSDGQMSHLENIKSAEGNNVDFFFATDHNLFLNSVEEDALENAKTVVYPSIEMTTHIGHFNIFFSENNPLDILPATDLLDEDKTLDKIEEISKNALVCLNHPCMEHFRFHYDLQNTENIFAMELINNPPYDGAIDSEEESLSAYFDLLNNGHRLWAAAGSDSHLRADNFDDDHIAEVIGDPAVFVYSENLGTDAMKRAMENGNMICSRFGPFDYSVNGKISGEDLDSKKLDIKISLPEKMLMQIYVNGKIIIKEKIKDFERKIDIKEDNFYIMAVFRDENYRLFGYTNPNFYGKIKLGKTPGEIFRQKAEEFSKIKAVLFDKDGTLIKLNHAWLKAIEEMFNGQEMKSYIDSNKIIVEKAIEEIKEKVGYTNMGMIPNSVLASGTFFDFAKVVEEYSHFCAEKIYMDLKKAILKFIKENSRDIYPVDGAKQLLETLKS